jgi:hypothetical protein
LQGTIVLNSSPRVFKGWKVVVNNNVFVLGTTDGVVLRWNIESGGEAEEIDISKKTEVRLIFLIALILSIIVFI